MYISWMIHGAASGIIIWFIIWAAFGHQNTMSDRGLFALGDLAFSAGILWTNVKCLILETRYKTGIVGVGFTITVGGWWAWNGFMASVYGNNLSPYDVKGGFTGTFGGDANWWGALVLGVGGLCVVELGYGAAKRWVSQVGVRRRRSEVVEMDVGVWQVLERDEGVRERLTELAGAEAGVDDDYDVDDDDDDQFPE